MAKTKEDILKIIRGAKPNYSNVIDKLTDEDYPVIENLIDDVNVNVNLAVKLVTYIGLLKSEKCLPALEIAAKSEKRELRTVAAFELRHLTNFPKAVSLINDLLDDPNLGVRKFALKTVAASKLINLKDKVELVLEKESNNRMKIFSMGIKDSLDILANNTIMH